MTHYFVCVCVCVSRWVCVCVRGREGEGERQRECVCERELSETLHNMNIFQDGSLLLDFSITLHICTARGLVFYMCMFWKLCVMSYTETMPSLVCSLILAHLLDCLVPLIRCWYKSTCFTGTEVQILTQTRNVCGTVYSESIQLRQKQQHSLAGQCTTHTRKCTSIQNTCHKVEC